MRGARNQASCQDPFANPSGLLDQGVCVHVTSASVMQHKCVYVGATANTAIFTALKKEKSFNI